MSSFSECGSMVEASPCAAMRKVLADAATQTASAQRRSKVGSFMTGNATPGGLMDTAFIRAVKRSAPAFVASILFASTSLAAEVKVMISGGLSAAYEELGRDFERDTGHKLATVKGPSIGSTPQAIPNRTDPVHPGAVCVTVAYSL